MFEAISREIAVIQEIDTPSSNDKGAAIIAAQNILIEILKLKTVLLQKTIKMEPLDMSTIKMEVIDLSSEESDPAESIPRPSIEQDDDTSPPRKVY